MKRHLSRLLSLVLVICISLIGFPQSASADASLTGDYRQDTVTVVDNLRAALQFPDDDPARISAQGDAKKVINDYVARYRRDPALAKVPSFTTMRTALNSLAGHYSSYPNRPVAQKMKDRLEQEFRQVEISLQRGS